MSQFRVFVMKRDELLLQLGDPLPLPYQVNGKPNSSNHSRTNSHDINIENFIKLRPKPIKRDIFNSLELKLRDLNTIGLNHDDIDVLKNIESDLHETIGKYSADPNISEYQHTIRQFDETKEFNAKEFNDLEDEVTNELLQAPPQSEIFQELNRWQSRELSRKIQIIILCTMLFLLFSYFVSDFKYGYCYYFC